jgi:hypothetical protein
MRIWKHGERKAGRCLTFHNHRWKESIGWVEGNVIRNRVEIWHRRNKILLDRTLSAVKPSEWQGLKGLLGRRRFPHKWAMWKTSPPEWVLQKFGRPDRSPSSTWQRVSTHQVQGVKYYAAPNLYRRRPPNTSVWQNQKSIVSYDSKSYF